MAVTAVLPRLSKQVTGCNSCNQDASYELHIHCLSRGLQPNKDLVEDDGRWSSIHRLFAQSGCSTTCDWVQVGMVTGIYRLLSKQYSASSICRFEDADP